MLRASTPSPYVRQLIEQAMDSKNSRGIQSPKDLLNEVKRLSPSDGETLKEKMEKLRISGMVEFAGFIDKEFLPAELSKGHVFAAPSYYEGGPGFVYLEAMACGLPVIGCSGSGIDEIIQHELTGMLVPPKNVNALADALRRVLEDSKFAKKLGMNARNYILKECDSDICLTKLEDYYYSVIKKCSIETDSIQ